MAASTSPEYDTAVERAREELRLLVEDVISKNTGCTPKYHTQDIKLVFVTNDTDDIDTFTGIVSVATVGEISPVNPGEDADKWNALKENARREIISGMASVQTTCPDIYFTVEASSCGEHHQKDHGCMFKIVLKSVIAKDSVVSRAGRAIYASTEQLAESDEFKCTLHRGRAPDASGAMRTGFTVDLTGDVEAAVKKTMDLASPKSQERLHEMGAKNGHLYVEIQRHDVEGSNRAMFTCMYTV